MLACPELPLDPPDVRATLEEPGREGVPGGVIRPVGQLGAAEQRLPDLLEEEGVPDRLRERWARLDPPVFAVLRGRDRHRPLMVRCSAVAASTSRGPSSWLKYFRWRAFALRLAPLPMEYFRSAAGLGPGSVVVSINDWK